MAITQPAMLLTLNGSSGTTATNYGATAVNPTANATENTQWKWNHNASELLGNWQSLIEGGGTNCGAIDCTSVTLGGTALTHLWAAVKFNLTARDTSASGYGYILGLTNFDGGIGVRAIAPSGGGDYDLMCRVSSSGGGVTSDYLGFTALSWSTDYSLVMALDATTPTSCTFKLKLGSNSVVSNTGVNFNGQTFTDGCGYLGRDSGFANYYGIQGKIYYAMKGRGVLLSDTDMATINSDPTQVTGWPGGGGSSHPFTGKFGSMFSGKF